MRVLIQNGIEVEIPSALILASPDDISGVVGIVRNKLEVIDSHAEKPESPHGLPEELIKRFVANAACEMGLTVEQFRNMPYFPLVELEPVEDLSRLAIRHYGFQAGAGRFGNVANVLRETNGVRGHVFALIHEDKEGVLNMMVESGYLSTDVSENSRHSIIKRRATVADCLDINRQIASSPGSRY